jgi:hypothetical protein
MVFLLKLLFHMQDRKNMLNRPIEAIKTSQITSASNREAKVSEVLHDTLLNELVEVVNQYNRSTFTPFVAYKIIAKNEYLVIASPGPYETNCTDVRNRIAAYAIAPPNQITPIKIVDICTGTEMLQTADFYFENIPSLSSKPAVGYTPTLKVNLANQDSKQLLEQGFDHDLFDQLNIPCQTQQLTTVDANNQKALVRAVENNDAKSLTNTLNTHHISPNTTDSNGQPLLVLAAKLGSFDVVKALVENEADVNARGNKYAYSSSALLAAVRALSQIMFSGTLDVKNNAHENIIRYLISKNADINARDNRGRTCLHDLAWCNTPELTQFFLNNHADPTITDICDARPVDSVTINSTSLPCLYQHVMHSDANNRVESWSYEKGIYHIHFKPDLSTNDYRWAFEAIVNKIKSQQINQDTGLLNNDPDHLDDINDSNCLMTTQGVATHKAKILTPTCHSYALTKIRGNREGIEITPAECYINDLKLHHKLKEIFATMGIQQAPPSQSLLANHKATLFSADDKNTAESIMTFSPMKNLGL